MTSQPRQGPDDRPTTLTIVVASTRAVRGGPVVAGWFAAVAGRRADLRVEVLDLAEVRLPDVGAAAAAVGTAVVSARLHGTDAFVIVTPEYNHSYPGPLKNAIDSFDAEWHAKPVGFVSYGGVSGGLRAVEHLRPVFAEVHATTVRETVSFAHYGELFDEAGRLRAPERATAAAERLLDQLVWWAQALRTARDRAPYAA
jgi:NAD(P)H-dependent FMN reductase